MHIPAEMINGAICPVTTAIAMTGVGAAGVALYKNREKAPSAGMFSLVTAAVFGLQMLNFPVWEGVSGHLLAGVLAASIIGVPAAVVSMTLVLLVQAFLFADGGVDMLGANITNMALIGTGLGGLLRAFLVKRGLNSPLATALAAAVAVDLAAGGLALELSAAGKGSWAMTVILLGIHALIALAEGTATGLMVLVWEKVQAHQAPRRAYATVGGLVALCLALIPIASAFPDGFEWVMERFSLLPEPAGFVGAPLAADLVASIPGAGTSTSALAAGVVGVLAVALCAFALMRPLAVRER